MEYRINAYLLHLEKFFNNRSLIISTEKSTAKLYTPETRQHSLQLNIKIDSIKLPIEKNCKILGVTLDTTCHSIVMLSQ